jgi:hypothetical protein
MENSHWTTEEGQGREYQKKGVFGRAPAAFCLSRQCLQTVSLRRVFLVLALEFQRKYANVTCLCVVGHPAVACSGLFGGRALQPKGIITAKKSTRMHQQERQHRPPKGGRSRKAARRHEKSKKFLFVDPFFAAICPRMVPERKWPR